MILNDQWFHECSRRIRGKGFDAMASTHMAGCVSIPDRKAFLQPTRLGDAYGLFLQVGEDVTAATYARLTAVVNADSSVSPGAVPYGYIVMLHRNDGTVDVGVRIGTFPYPAGIAELSQQLRALEDIAQEARAHVESLRPLRTPLSLGKEGIILELPRIFVETPNFKSILSFVTEHLNHTYGERLIIVAGMHGIGKVTALLKALESLGIAAIELANSVGVPLTSLVERFNTLAQTLAGRKDAVLVLRAPLGDRILSRTESSDLLRDFLRDLSRRQPVIVLSEQRSPVCNGAVVLHVEAEPPAVIAEILEAHYPGAMKGHSIPTPKNTKISNPLYSLQKIAAGENASHIHDDVPPITVARLMQDIRSEYLGNEDAVQKIVNFVVSQHYWPPHAKQASRNMVIMLAGRSGVGKSMLGESLASALHTNLVRIACNEEAGAAVMFRSRLVGSSAGYVGYGDEAKLDAVIAGDDACFGSVILWDEIEKCSIETRNILLSHMQDGVIETSRKTLTLHNNIFLLTTNHAVRELDRASLGFHQGDKSTVSLKTLYRKDGFFLTEFLSRVHLIVQLDAHGDDTCVAAIKRELCNTVFNKSRGTLCVEGCIDEIAATLYRQYREELDSYGIRRAEVLVREHVLAHLVPFIEQHVAAVIIRAEDNGLSFFVKQKKHAVEKQGREHTHSCQNSLSTTEERKEAMK